MSKIDWKPISELPSSGSPLTAYDPTLCQGYRIVTRCYAVNDNLYDFEGVILDGATHFADGLNEPGD